MGSRQSFLTEDRVRLSMPCIEVCYIHGECTAKRAHIFTRAGLKRPTALFYDWWIVAISLLVDAYKRGTFVRLLVRLRMKIL